ncbi:putative solute-binding protein [Salinisphaera hydrothermalis]|uniref:RND type efflux pump n=1 Tax=Salinisphaera hydrothermalis (strain C41B8) TaxID=1304275 RepID=A0A084IGS4_SALHC|nr:putative solute-binding protein [Salinisphaera hydrothermalis]KEZ75908.1 RND type efflux pump [Salinisphaera hydrothermalis C41B8]
MTRNLITRRLAGLALGAVALAAGALQPAAATETRTLCIYDPIGANGFIYQSFQDYIVQARSWGIKLKPKAYTDEAVAANDFKAGKCDMAAITGVRDIHFVKFAGSLDMAGGLQTYAQEKTAIQVMSSPKAAKYMQQGGYEVAGVVPLGKAFLFARNRNDLDSLKKLAGKKIAVLSYDKQASTLANVAGASPVGASIASLGPMFNNGSVDLAYAPSFAYDALELYKGLGNNGGIADFVLGMLSGQLVFHKDKFPADFGQKSRTWVFNNMYDPTMRRVKRSDNKIPDKYWVHISGERDQKYREMFRKTRQKLWDDGWYSHKMQHLLKKIRCSTHPGLAECSLDSEGGPVH